MKKLLIATLTLVSMYANAGITDLVHEAGTYISNPKKYYVDQLCGAGADSVLYTYTGADTIGLMIAPWVNANVEYQSNNLDLALPDFSKRDFLIQDGKLMVKSFNGAFAIATVTKRFETSEGAKEFICLNSIKENIALEQVSASCLTVDCAKEQRSGKKLTETHSATFLFRNLTTNSTVKSRNSPHSAKVGHRQLVESMLSTRD